MQVLPLMNKEGWLLLKTVWRSMLQARLGRVPDGIFSETQFQKMHDDVTGYETDINPDFGSLFCERPTVVKHY